MHERSVHTLLRTPVQDCNKTSSCRLENQTEQMLCHAKTPSPDFALSLLLNHFGHKFTALELSCTVDAARCRDIEIQLKHLLPRNQFGVFRKWCTRVSMVIALLLEPLWGSTCVSDAMKPLVSIVWTPYLWQASIEPSAMTTWGSHSHQ